MSNDKKDEPEPLQSGPVLIAEIIPEILGKVIAQARLNALHSQVQNDFRIHVPNPNPDDHIPN